MLKKLKKIIIKKQIIKPNFAKAHMVFNSNRSNKWEH